MYRAHDVKSKSACARHARNAALFLVASTVFFGGRVFAEPAMWVARDNDSTIYFIGTVHLLRRGTDWNSDKVRRALAESNELWLEIADPDNQAALIPLIQQYGIDPNNPLSHKLDSTEAEKLNKVATEYQVPVSLLEPMQPWMAAITLMALPLQKAGYDPNGGVDLFLKKEAEKKGEKIKGFETLEQQTRFLAELSQRDQIAFLDDTLDDVEKGTELLNNLAVAWLNGNTNTIRDLLATELKAKAPAIYQKLLVDRNVRWASQIEQMLHGSGVQLVAVGAAHLVGPDSIQVQLTKHGIKVEPY